MESVHFVEVFFFFLELELKHSIHTLMYFTRGATAW